MQNASASVLRARRDALAVELGTLDRGRAGVRGYARTVRRPTLITVTLKPRAPRPMTEVVLTDEDEWQRPRIGHRPLDPSFSMELFDTTQLGLERALERCCGCASRRSRQNIANVNTPGYRRQDVDFQSALPAAWGQARMATRVTCLPQR